MKHQKRYLISLVSVLFSTLPLKLAIEAHASPAPELARRGKTVAAIFKDAVDSANVPQAAAPGKAVTEAPLPDGKGKELTKKLCSNCHSTNVWTNQHHTNEKWNSIIDNMVSKGMVASDDDLEVVGDYLTVYFGPVTPASKPPAGTR